MVWGCIMKGSKGPLVVLDYPGGRGGGMTADRYQEQVLDNTLYDYYLKMSEERGQVAFQQDGAPSHRAKSTLSWLSHNSIETFPHPASSPDISPIEPLWKTFKTFIRARPHIPSSINELKLAAQEAWGQISVDDIDSHVRHMEDRVQCLIRAAGGHTPF